MFEKTGVDLGVIAAATAVIAVAQAAAGVSWRRLPLLCTLYPAYALAVGGSLLYGCVR